MSPPALLGWGLVTGAALGIVYDFLRPLRQRHHAPADLIFVLLMLCAWVQYSFGICLGRIRLVTTAAFLLGLWLWERTISRLLRPVFFGFWRGIFRILGWITFPAAKIFEKIRKFGKKVFASLKKRGTMVTNSGQPLREKNGRSRHEKEKKSLFPD